MLKEYIHRLWKSALVFLAMLLAGSVHFAGGRAFSAEARPIIILEDIEARFHPSMLLSFWSIIEMMSLQKLVTTNSGDLLSALPLEALRRLQRERYDTRSFKVSSGALPREDLRRIAFHVRLNRPMTLFARCWLLVEGETETWILSQAAALLGMSLPCAGIRPVEFAQCGLAPLIRFARQLGIGFFVVTDGDEAGKKYAATVRGMVGSQQAGEHLCVLPEVDIEHYLYAHGYAQVMRRCAGSAGQMALPGGKKTQAAEAIIKAAIRKKTKPGLALSIIEEMQRRGTQGVPTVLAAMFEKLRLRYVDK